MTNIAPKSFPREHLLNMSGTFEDKVRQMLAGGNSNDTKSTRADTQPVESSMKKVPVVRKPISKPITSQHPPIQRHEPIIHQPTQYRQQPFVNEPNRGSIFHQSAPMQGYYPQHTSNPTPQIYPNTFPQNQTPPNLQRHPMMPPVHNQQLGMPYQGFHQNQGMQNNQPYYSGISGISGGINSNMHPTKEFLIKVEEPMYNAPDRGSQILFHENHDTFSNGSTASTNELSIAKTGSLNINSNSFSKGMLQDFDRSDRERGGPYQPFSTILPNRDPMQNLDISDSFSPDEDSRFGYADQIKPGRERQERIFSPKASNTLKKKLAKPFQKPTRPSPVLKDSLYSGKGLSSQYLDTQRAKSIKFPQTIEEGLEEGELPNFTPISKESLSLTSHNPNPLLDTYISKSKNTENELKQDDTVPFLYDSKSYFIDAVSFSFF